MDEGHGCHRLYQRNKVKFEILISLIIIELIFLRSLFLSGWSGKNPYFGCQELEYVLKCLMHTQKFLKPPLSLTVVSGIFFVSFPHRNRWTCINFSEPVTYESKWPARGHSNKLKQCYLKQIQTTSPTLKPEVSTWVKTELQCFAPVVTYLLIMAAGSFPSVFFKAWRYVPSPFPNAAQLEKEHSWSLRISSTTFCIFA